MGLRRVETRLQAGIFRDCRNSVGQIAITVYNHWSAQAVLGLGLGFVIGALVYSCRRPEVALPDWEGALTGVVEPQ